MKKLFIVLFVLGAFSTISFAQATKQLNFGIIGASYEIPVTSAITIAPAAAGSNLNLDYLTIGVKANYYLDALIGLPAAWDVYAGANLGYALGLDNNGNDFNLGLQIGGRYFWSPKWGVYIEAGGGKVGGGSAGIGLTMKL